MNIEQMVVTIARNAARQMGPPAIEKTMSLPRMTTLPHLFGDNPYFLKLNKYYQIVNSLDNGSWHH
jgi:hypothetical protein